jgi:hypothetical protein
MERIESSYPADTKTDDALENEGWENPGFSLGGMGTVLEE